MKKKKRKKAKKFDFKKWYNSRDSYVKFFLCIIVTLLLLILFKSTYIFSGVTEPVGLDSEIKSDTIITDEKDYNINVTYPKFKNLEVKKIITNYIYDYIYNFKVQNKRLGKTNSNLNIDYEIIFLNDKLLVYFTISDSLNSSRINKSIIIDTTKSQKLEVNEFLKNNNLLKQIVISKACKKYTKTICKKVKKVNVNDYDIKVEDNKLIITFNNFNTGLIISYVPQVSISLNELESVYNYETLKVFNEIKKPQNINKKYISFTFDDGPSKYTNQILDALVENEAKATFFQLGSRMKHEKIKIQRLRAFNMEIGGHSYSHSILPNLSKKALRFEFNTTNIIYNEITGEYLSLVRPPYGSVSKFVRKNSSFALINWSVDTKDWLYLNSNKVYKHILKHSKDGDIILMHDIYPTTVEAVRLALPELKARNYEIVTVSELAKIKGVELKKGKIYRKFR